MLVGRPAQVGLLLGGDMPEINLNEKIPGTYCPLCGERGLRKLVASGVTWAVCPMIDGKPEVKKLEQAHTAYVLDTGKSKAKPKPIIEQEPELDEENNEEGVNHG
jgi:hypothetical protein